MSKVKQLLYYTPTKIKTLKCLNFPFVFYFHVVHKLHQNYIFEFLWQYRTDALVLHMFLCLFLLHDQFSSFFGWNFPPTDDIHSFIDFTARVCG